MRRLLIIAACASLLFGGGCFFMGGGGVDVGASPGLVVTDGDPSNVPVTGEIVYVAEWPLEDVEDDTFYLVELEPEDPPPGIGIREPITDPPCDAEQRVEARTLLSASKMVASIQPILELRANTFYETCMERRVKYEGGGTAGGWKVAIKTEPDPTPPTPPSECEASPTTAEVRAAITDPGANPTGVRTGEPFVDVTLPEFTGCTGDVEYNVSGLPATFSFDPVTRILSSSVLGDMSLPIVFAYAPYADGTDTIYVALNDELSNLDGTATTDGMVDEDEYANRILPLINIQNGYLVDLDATLEDLLVPEYGGANSVYNAIVGTAIAMDLTNPDDGLDDTSCSFTGLPIACDFDGDNISNYQELIVDDTNPFATHRDSVTFSTSDTPAITNPRTVNVGDFDEDGILDLAISRFGQLRVTIFTGDEDGSTGRGDGTFTQGNTYVVGGNVPSSGIGDFDEDGHLDFIALNIISHAAEFWQGNGDATFTYQADINLSGSTPWRMTTCDMDEDGHLDIAVALYAGNAVDVLIGNGDGTFGAATPYAGGTNPQTVICAELTGDEHLDLMTANLNSTTATLMTGDGAGGFVLSSTPVMGFGGIGVQAADFDLDGTNDIVASSSTTTALYVFSNNAGVFTLEGSLGTVGANAQAVAVADFNGDKLPDIVVATQGVARVSVFINSSIGVGDFSFNAAVQYVVGLGPYGVAVGDFNNDGAIDIVSSNDNANTLSILLNEE